MTIELLNKSELAKAMKRHPNYVTAMLRAGYEMEFGDQTTLSHALAWRRKNPHFVAAEHPAKAQQQPQTK